MQFVTAPTEPWQQPRRRFPGFRLARDIEHVLCRVIGPHHPREVLAPAEIALVNRLLVRGGRFFAAVRDYEAARPFPAASALETRLAVLALFRLLVRIDPRVLDQIREPG